MNIQDRVLKIVSIESELSDVTINNTKASLGMDSLDELILIIKIEDEFEIDISDDDMGKLNSVSEIIDLVNKIYSYKQKRPLDDKRLEGVRCIY